MVCGASALTSFALVGCSSDDTSTPAPADAAPDHTTSDATAGDSGGGGNDATTVDSSTKPDGSDASDASDASKPDSGSTAQCIGYLDGSTLDAMTLQAGMGFVQQFNCAKCHQDQLPDAGIFLSGKTAPLGDAAVYAPNLTPDLATGLGCWTSDQITQAMLNGIGPDGGGFCVMPKFASRGMEAGAAEAISEYLRTLPVVSNQVPASVCPPVSDAAAGDGAADADAGAPADGASPSDAGDASPG
jgi:hypothetical protein